MSPWNPLEDTNEQPVSQPGMSMRQKILKFFGREKPTLEQEALDEAQLLDKDILNRELELIDKQFKVQAQRVKKEFLLEWLQRDTPKTISHASARSA